MTVRIAAIAALALLAGCTERPEGMPPPPVAPAGPPTGMQYLYGSAEGAAASSQAYAALVGFVGPAVKERRSVVLAADATITAPRFTDCGDKPPAVVFDMDETLVLNIGYERLEALDGKGFDAARWGRWEQAGATGAVPVPGAVRALAELRRQGVTPIANTNRTAANAAGAEAALNAAGLGAFKHGETLFLMGDVDGQRGKDGRRQAIAGRFCVIALVGDQLGDFSDLKADPPARRAMAQSPSIDGLWGRGWFVLPNPVYGSALAGTWDQVFPVDTYWADPADQGGK